MSASKPDPRDRPPDPAGTRPKVTPESLLPESAAARLALTQGDEPSADEPSADEPSADEPSADQPSADQSSASQPSTSEPAALAPALAGSLPARFAPRPIPGANAARFQFIHGLLGAIGLGSVAFAVALIAGGSGSGAPEHTVPWSAWSPQSGKGDFAAQIAQHVGPEYKLPSGHQLLSVTGGPQSIGGQPVVLALRTSGSEPTPLPNNGVFYQLCGHGPNCSIGEGKATLQRGLLVRREALELALYTFHYLESASQVVVTFPPAPPSSSSSSSHKGASGQSSIAGIPTINEGGSSSSSASSSSSSSPSSSSSKTTIHGPSRVLLFRPDEVGPQLSRPLAATLSRITPTVNTMNASPDAKLVERLTANSIYDSVLIQEQQSSLVMLLQPPSLGG